MVTSLLAGLFPGANSSKSPLRNGVPLDAPDIDTKFPMFPKRTSSRPSPFTSPTTVDSTEVKADVLSVRIDASRLDKLNSVGGFVSGGEKFVIVLPEKTKPIVPEPSGLITFVEVTITSSMVSAVVSNTCTFSPALLIDSKPDSCRLIRLKLAPGPVATKNEVAKSVSQLRGHGATAPA